MPEKPSPLVSLSVFVLMLVLTRQAIGLIMPPPPYFRDKLLYFEANKDEYDLIFFGASDMHWGISPAIFDDQLAKQGIPLKSFNLAVMASTGYEIDHMIRWALATRPQRLKYVVISWRAWSLEPGEEVHERQIWWHSLTETMLLLNGLMLDRMPGGEKFETAQAHIGQALRKFVHLGLGPGLVRYLMQPGAEPGNRSAARRGFQPLTEATVEEIWPEGVKLRQEFLQAQEEYLEFTKLMAGESGRALEESRAQVDPYLAQILPRLVYSVQAQVEFLERHDIVPIHILPPTHDTGNIPRRLKSEGYIPELLTFDDPGEYPDLFEIPQRFDQTHLNASGAELYSRHLADRVAEFLRSNGAREGRVDARGQ